MIKSSGNTSTEIKKARSWKEIKKVFLLYIEGVEGLKSEADGQNREGWNEG